MKAYVFTDEALSGEAGRFVWLSIDTERKENAEIRKRLAIRALPTLFVLNPADESVALRWVGGATVPQLRKILDDGRATVAGGGATEGAPPVRGADAALARADRSYGEAKYADAADAYREAIGAAPPDWPGYPRAIESLLYALSEEEAWMEGAVLARDAYPRLRSTPSGANVAATGLFSALSLPADTTGRGELIAALEAAAKEAVADLAIPMSADDRSGVFIAIIEARDDAKDEAGKMEWVRRWAEFLDEAAAKAETPEARAVFDSHRLSAYMEMGEPERAIPMLEASERDLPEDYNPPARLAVAYKAMKKWDEALAASDRAMARVYGPRKLGVYSTRADILVGLGDTGGARKTLEEAIAYAEALPPGHRSEGSIGGLRKKLEGLAPASGSGTPPSR